MANRRCPACAEESGDKRGEKNGFQLISCGNCGTLYAYYSAGTREDFNYDAYYHEANLSVPAFITQRLDEIFSEFASFRRTNRLLDIGCGAGSLLQAARRAGWEAEGTEISPPAIEQARDAGFKVFHGDLVEAKYPDGYFDVVAASEILEHLPDPQAMLGEIARVLRPGGLFWGTTPHGQGLSARVLGHKWSTIAPPEHLHLFSLAGVRRILTAAEFTRIRVTSQGCNPYELWQVLRHGGNACAANGTLDAEAGFERVNTSYQLNEMLMRNFATRLLKASINSVLSAARLGDSIKIWAIK